MSGLSLQSKLDPYVRYVNRLSHQIKNSISWYTQHNYKKFNKILREQGDLDSEMLSHLYNIDLAFENAPVLDFPITVFRGIKNSNEAIADKSFMSTSIDYNVADGFSECCIIDITVAAGNKILPLWDISDQYDEFEILLNRNQILTITHERILLKKIFYSTFLPSTSKIIESNSTPNIKTIESANEKESELKEKIIKISDNIIDILSDPDELELLDLDIHNKESLTEEIKSQYKIYSDRYKIDNNIPDEILIKILNLIHK